MFLGFLRRNMRHKRIPQNPLADYEIKVFPYPTLSLNNGFLPSIFSNTVLICSHDSFVELYMKVNTTINSMIIVLDIV